VVREVTCWKEAHATTMKAILREYLQEEVDTLRPRTLEVVNGSAQPSLQATSLQSDSSLR